MVTYFDTHNEDRGHVHLPAMSGPERLRRAISAISAARDSLVGVQALIPAENHTTHVKINRALEQCARAAELLEG